MAATILYRLTWPLLLLYVTSARPSTTSGAEEGPTVPEPFNLTVDSYNLNTTLHWDYSTTESTPDFCVEILDKIKMKWMVIETCQNISHQFCDVSYKIIDPVTYYKFRVKALAGSQTSKAVTIEFSLSSVGIIGPPVLSGYIEEKIIVIDIFHPKVPSIHESMLDLNYIIYYGNDSQEVDDCDIDVCTAAFSISDEKTYCYSAKGISNEFPGMTMEKSKEFCIYAAEENSRKKLSIGIIIGVVVGVLVVLAISCFVIARWTKARTLMPQSLSSVVRNMVSYAYMPKQQTPRYDNVATSPIESTVDKITYIEENVKTDTDASTDTVSKESTDPGYQGSLTENELKTDEKEDDPFNSSNYFHTDSSSSGGHCIDTSESEKDEKIPEHAPEPPKTLPNSFGYDKPHFPKELI